MTNILFLFYCNVHHFSLLSNGNAFIFCKIYRWSPWSSLWIRVKHTDAHSNIYLIYLASNRSYLSVTYCIFSSLLFSSLLFSSLLFSSLLFSSLLFSSLLFSSLLFSSLLFFYLILSYFICSIYLLSSIIFKSISRSAGGYCIWILYHQTDVANAYRISLRQTESPICTHMYHALYFWSYF